LTLVFLAVPRPLAWAGLCRPLRAGCDELPAAPVSHAPLARSAGLGPAQTGIARARARRSRVARRSIRAATGAVEAREAGRADASAGPATLGIGVEVATPGLAAALALSTRSAAVARAQVLVLVRIEQAVLTAVAIRSSASAQPVVAAARQARAGPALRVAVGVRIATADVRRLARAPAHEPAAQLGATVVATAALLVARRRLAAVVD